MSHAPRVSIVIPVHNDEETIAATLESCLAQTHEDFEVVCVDDASSDRTVHVVERFAARDQRIRLIRQERNLSALQARRTGVFAAGGEFILFADGDDELKPDAAEVAVDAADSHRADIVGFGVEVLDDQGRVVGGYQNRLAPKHKNLVGKAVLQGLFPPDEPAQGQLWRYLFSTQLLRDAYALIPADLSLPRVNDLPLMYLTATLAHRYVSIDSLLYRYHYGRGGSGQSVDTLEQAKFYAEAIRSVESIQPAVRTIARTIGDPGTVLDNYESVRLSIIGYVTAYLLKHTSGELVSVVLDHLHTRVSATDLIVAAARFYPECLSALKAHSAPVGLGRKPVRSVMLTTRLLTTGGVSNVLVTQAVLLMQAGYRVTIVARRYGSDPSAVPEGAKFVEMAGRGLPERLIEWGHLCADNEIDVIIDHQVLYSRDWPEYALIGRALGVATIGWLHNFAGRPIYDLNGLHALLKSNAPLLEMLISLSPLDVAFWKLRGIQNVAFVPNPPSPILLESAGKQLPKQLTDGRRELIWWGRLDERTKQVTHLIDVADELRKQSIDFHLTVVGPDWDGWTADRFNALARKRRLDRHVEAVGELRGRGLIEAIDAADAFVTTSVIEGYQLTIAEAQSRGLPVFMYELPWLTLVQENQGVVAVRQGDSAGLARELVTAFSSADRYAELSRHSIAAAHRELSYNFSVIYEQVVAGALPSQFSPEPTLDDARQLLDLMIFFAERNAGAHVQERSRRRSTASIEKPSSPTSQRASLGYRAWRAMTPLGRTMLQVFPGLRPLAHRAKKALLTE